MSTRQLLKRLIGDATRRIESIGAGHPRLEAEHLITAALGIDRARFLALDEEAPLDPAALDRFREMLRRRVEEREPLQYILGTVPFCDLVIEVGPGVLIPRSETEVLVEEIGRWAERSPACAGRPWIVDVGTGSGAILLALLARIPAARGIGIDLSAEALDYARRNARRAEGTAGTTAGNTAGTAAGTTAGVAGRVWFLRGDLLEPIGLTREICSILVSNPPYIPSEEIAGLAPEIRRHEPGLALDGGPGGLDLAERICDAARELLLPGGLLALELSLGQPDRIAARLRSEGRFEEVRVYRDLTGRERGLLAVRRA